MEYISNENYQRLLGVVGDFLSVDDFHTELKRLTGIGARPYYTVYQYFDKNGNFLANSDDATLDELLEAAYIEVEDGE